MTTRQRIPRLAEFMVLFLLVPIALWRMVAIGTAIPVVPLLLLAGSAATVHLLRAAPGHLQASLMIPRQRGEFARIALQLALGTALLLACLVANQPDWLHASPRWNAAAWAWFLALYPLLSVLPQELYFRAFFFHRYGKLWGGTRATVAASAMTFGLAHLCYGSWLAVALATVGGAFFSWTFVRTGSLLLVILEHSAYGALLFTLGLGRLFHLES